MSPSAVYDLFERLMNSSGVTVWPPGGNRVAVGGGVCGRSGPSASSKRIANSGDISTAMKNHATPDRLNRRAAAIARMTASTNHTKKASNIVVHSQWPVCEHH